MASGFERFRDAAREVGVAVEPVRYPAGTRTAADAAAAVGCDVGQIVKSLVLATPTKLVLALTSGANQVDTDRLGELVGEEISLAEPEAVRAATGFAIGGTPPFGHLNPLPTWIDEDLLVYDAVWAAAGTPDSCFPIAPDRLAGVTEAIPADFIRLQERKHMGRWLVENMPRGLTLELPDRSSDRPVSFVDEHEV